MGKIDMRCPHCGGANIYKDAAASWDVDAQQWTLAHESCEDCERSGNDMAEREPL